MDEGVAQRAGNNGSLGQGTQVARDGGEHLQPGDVGQSRQQGRQSQGVRCSTGRGLRRRAACIAWIQWEAGHEIVRIKAKGALQAVLYTSGRNETQLLAKRAPHSSRRAAAAGWRIARRAAAGTPGRRCGGGATVCRTRC